MADLADFFDLQKNVKRKILPGSRTKGFVEIKDGDIYDDIYPAEKPSRGTDYAREYVEKEKEELTKILTNTSIEQIHNDAPGMCDIDSLTSIGTAANIGDITSEVLTQVYDQYDFSKNCNNSLPVYIHKEKIESVINAYQVTVIHGATGCGKSTQIPQYILDYCVKNRAPCNIVITQPRRIAAISLARRVSQERGWPLGSLVGYQVGLMNETSEDTRLKYVTTGVLLQQLVNKRSMTDFTHIILDEVHERDQDMDFAILVVKKLLRTNSQGVKVILMSATFNVTKFAEYFAIPVRDKLVPAPIINLDEGIPQTGFRVREIYLCQMGVLGPLPEPQENDPNISDQMYKLTVKLIKEFDKIEKEEEVLKKGAVLVFLPGIYEIEELYTHLMLTQGYKWWVKPLHSSITVGEQQEVFKPPPTGCRKIILATNIAESSITVSDIVFVIDFCLTKCLICDQTTSYSSLQLCWASKTNCIQRAGRAGRVADGRVYRLVPQHFFDNILDQEGIPEMLRCPLERLVLQAKLFGMGTPKGLLALALDPPDLTNLESTVLVLKEAGALLPLEGDELNPFDGDITFLGRVMAKLPVDIYVSKLIVLGHIYSVLEECIIMGAAMSLKSVFSAPFQERLAAYNSKLTWADSSCSDSTSFLNAYKVWSSHKQNGYFNRSAGGGEQSWARRYFIQLKTMNEIHLLVNELMGRLKYLGIEITVGPERVNWADLEKPLVLKIVLAGAFYPNFFVRGAHGGQIDEGEAVKLLGGKDPFSAVYFQGMPMDQPGPLYVKTVKHALKDCAEEIKVVFDRSSKVVVEFGRKKMEMKNEMAFKADLPGKIHIGVYRAVKIRQLKIPVTLYLLKPQEAQQRAEKLGIDVRSDTLYNWQKNTKPEGSQPKKTNCLPPVDVSWIEIRIEHIIDPGHFWATNADESSNAIKVWLMRQLTEEVCLPLPSLILKQVQVGKVYLAPYTDDFTNYYRAKVQAIIPRQEGEAIVQVFFIDYGNTEQMPISKLRNFTQEMIFEQMTKTPPLAFECILSELQPSLIKNPQGIWTNEARCAFQRAIVDTSLYAKVYSVVNGVVSLELLKRISTGHLSINEWLIKEGYAQRAEESYLSKMNHEMRLTNADMDLEARKACEDPGVTSSFGAEEQDPEPPKREECRMQRSLRGPFSPLEMHVYGLTKASIAKTVQIEWNSVNSVLLDCEPQDPHDRLLVAQSVGQSVSGDRLTLRHTTLMPNIHGLPALIALIFAPFAELRTDENRTRLTGALCGLGYDTKTGRSMFPDHDMEITFDTEFNMTDMLDINRIRYWMNNALYKERDEEMPERGPKEFALCQDKMKKYLFKLLKVKRKSQEIIVQRRQFHWQQLPAEHLLNPSETEVDRRSIFRLHWGVELAKEDIIDYNRQMWKHIQELQAMANGRESFKELTCKLCHVRLFSIISLKLHLQTAQHLENEQEIRRYR